MTELYQVLIDLRTMFKINLIEIGLRNTISYHHLILIAQKIFVTIDQMLDTELKLIKDNYEILYDLSIDQVIRSDLIKCLAMKFISILNNPITIEMKLRRKPAKICKEE